MGEKKSADLEFHELAEDETPNSPTNSQDGQGEASRGKKKQKKDGENQSNVSNYIVRCSFTDPPACRPMWYADWLV
jgi:hypothetical protein